MKYYLGSKARISINGVYIGEASDVEIIPKYYKDMVALSAEVARRYCSCTTDQKYHHKTNSACIAHELELEVYNALKQLLARSTEGVDSD
jgi:hypothetical protein